jgi:hypothetical protein
MSEPNQTPSPAGDVSGQPDIGGYQTISNLDLMFALDWLCPKSPF